jgi:hypothetical protein
MLPNEVWPKDGYFILSYDQDTINQEIKESRKSESAWPGIHYLWEQHPVLEWVRDKLLSNFDRLEAPQLRLSTLDADEAIFIVSGLIPNRKAHPLINHWMGVRFKSGKFVETMTMQSVVELSKLGKQKFANKAQDCNTLSTTLLLPKAIEEAKVFMFNEYTFFEKEINKKLEHHHDELEKLKERHLGQLELDFSQKSKKLEQERHIKKIFDNYYDWIEETMTPEKEPYIQVIAVLCGDEA